ncbi:hypothetical protein CMI37_27340 [Candidatus Pacearchaeota archaeon]|nr:hypothetical protein [Candidatus Pacearchaeota archaeon]|tara:strand:- start:6099 stop:6287 length:189 start_codon:yes stop_codon:yes gene_type:complete
MKSKKQDLQIKIATQEEAYWTDIKEKCEESIFQKKNSIEMDKKCLKLAIKKLALEEEKKLKK